MNKNSLLALEKTCSKLGFDLEYEFDDTAFQQFIIAEGGETVAIYFTAENVECFLAGYAFMYLRSIEEDPHEAEQYIDNLINQYYYSYKRADQS